MKATRKRLFLIICSAILCGIQIFAQSPDNHKIGIVAHRGFWNCEQGGHTRNSIAALKAAQDNGFWGSEFDVNMTRDGVLLVWHDNHIDGKLIEEHNYDQFKDVRLDNGEPIPTIDEYLTQGKKNKNTILVYEIKAHSTPWIEDRVVDMTLKKLKEYKLYNPKRVIFISFSFHICYRLAQLAPQFTIQYLANDRTPAELHRYGINGVDYHHNEFVKHPDWLNEAKGLGMSVNTWTVNKTDDMKKVIEKGVDFITTDNPLDVRKQLVESGIKENK